MPSAIHLLTWPTDTIKVEKETKNSSEKSYADPFASELENLVQLATKDLATSTATKPEEVKLTPVRATPKNTHKKTGEAKSIQIRLSYFGAACCVALMLCAGVVALPKIHASLTLAPQLEEINQRLHQNNAPGYTALDAAADMGSSEYHSVDKITTVELEMSEEPTAGDLPPTHLAIGRAPRVNKAEIEESLGLEEIVAMLTPPHEQICQ